jgi:hypothetical protein
MAKKRQVPSASRSDTATSRLQFQEEGNAVMGPNLNFESEFESGVKIIIPLLNILSFGPVLQMVALAVGKPLSHRRNRFELGCEGMERLRV